jgi:hypothetical protein
VPRQLPLKISIASNSAVGTVRVDIFVKAVWIRKLSRNLQGRDDELIELLTFLQENSQLRE